VRHIAEDFDQVKALAHEHHIFTESSEPAEIGPMGTTPIGQAPIAFTLIVRKADVDFIEAPIRYLGRFDDTARFSTSVEHDPALTGRRSVRLLLCATSRGLDAFDYEFKQFVCEFRTVAERERPEVSIPFGDLFHVLPRLQRSTVFAGQPNRPGTARKHCTGGNVPMPAVAFLEIVQRRAISVAKRA
jgi:hypothetical protein